MLGQDQPPGSRRQNPLARERLRRAARYPWPSAGWRYPRRAGRGLLLPVRWVRQGRQPAGLDDQPVRQQPGQSQLTAPRRPSASVCRRKVKKSAVLPAEKYWPRPSAPTVP